MVTGVRTLGQKVLRFTLRQSRNWKTMLIRRSLQAVGMNLSEQYNLIYATALGANPVQLGSLQSAGNAMGALISPPAGWLIDNYSLKKVFLLGTVMLAVSAALYFVAPHWAYLYGAIILYYMGMRVTCTCCTVTCATELANEERATGRGLCRTVSSVVALVAPMLGAWVVAISGGINVTGLRPLYAVQVVIYALLFGFLIAMFLDPAVAKRPREGWHVFADFVDVFRRGHDVTKVMFMIALIELPWCMVSPFMPLFAHQFKGADEFVLGGIATATRVAPLLVAIPLGRLADRHGRKKLLFLLAPLSNAANLCLIFAPGRNMLLLSGLLFGLNSISTGIAAAMAAEIVPKGQMGRWIGMISLMRGLISIPAPLIAGLIWDQIGPEYVFIAATLIDLVVRLPLLASIRETLHLDMENCKTLE
jgi:MFS family permease